MKKIIISFTTICVVIVLLIVANSFIIHNTKDDIGLNSLNAIGNNFYAGLDESFWEDSTNIFCFKSLTDSSQDSEEYIKISLSEYDLIYSVHRISDGTFYCGARSNNEDYILHLDSGLSVLDETYTSKPPLEFYEYKDSILALFNENNNGVLKTINKKDNEADIRLNNISLEREYIALENLYVKNSMIAYKSAKEPRKWIILENMEEKFSFSSKDRCFGFVNDGTLLFYHPILKSIGIGKIYTYDFKDEDKKTIGITSMLSVRICSVDESGRYLYVLYCNLDSSDLSGLHPCVVDLQAKKKKVLKYDVGSPSNMQFYTE